MIEWLFQSIECKFGVNLFEWCHQSHIRVFLWSNVSLINDVITLIGSYKILMYRLFQNTPLNAYNRLVKV